MPEESDLMEFQEPDPADALRELLAQRERAKKTVYAAAMAREKAEEELAHREKLFQMQIEETQKLASENAGLRSEKGELEARVKLVEDAAAVQALRLSKVQKRMDEYSILIAETQRKLYEAYVSEDESMLPPEVEAGIDASIAEHKKEPMPKFENSDLHEGPHGYEGVETVMEKPSHYDAWGGLFPFTIRTPIDYVKKPLVLVTVIALPFLLITFFNALMLVGFKVQFVADLITPLWQPWMGGLDFVLLMALIPVSLYALLFFFQRRVSRVDGPPPLEEFLKTEVKKIAPESPIADADTDKADRLKQIDDIFGADEDA